jgi:heme/copper-type cytochrome/quinol oxidase subunit 2
MNKLFLAAIIGALVIGVGVSYYYPSMNTPLETQPTSSATSGCTVPAGYILIIADIDGYNDSVAQLEQNSSAPWPVIRVNLGERVNIIVCDTDDYSPHGFAIYHYFDGGTAIMPHQSFKISFVADEVGTFRIYCAIFCPVHPYMQNDELIVTS